MHVSIRFSAMLSSTNVLRGGTRGIGAAIALGLAEAGADIVLVQVKVFECQLFIYDKKLIL